MRTELLITAARKVILAMNKCVFNFIDILMKAVEDFSTKINNFSAFKSIKTFDCIIKKSSTNLINQKGFNCFFSDKLTEFMLTYSSH